MYHKNPGGGINFIEETYYIRDASGNIMTTYTLKNQDFTWTEAHLYGSSRLGLVEVNKLLHDASGPVNSPLPPDEVEFYRGKKRYELSNHLGNVLAVVSDKRTLVCISGTQYYEAEIISASDYYPFGMLMEERSYTATARGYRFGFNGQEGDDEVSGNGNQYDYGFRIYNPRLGKFLSVDPLTSSYPWYTPYQFAGNKPVVAIDLDGLEEFIVIRWFEQGKFIGVTVTYLPDNPRVRRYAPTHPRYNDVVTLDIEYNEQQFKLVNGYKILQWSSDNTRVTGLNQFAINLFKSAYSEKWDDNFTNCLEYDYGQENKTAVNNTIRGQLEPLSGFHPNLNKISYDHNETNPITLGADMVEIYKQHLLDNPDYNLEIVGHTDKTGTEEYNNGLGKRRAKEVYDLLIKGGIDPTRLSYRSAGESEATVSETASEGKRAVDRKVLLDWSVNKQ